MKPATEWVLKHSAIEGHICFFESYQSSSEFYRKTAKLLLSMHTVGSIDVERRVKPNKNEIIDQEAHRASENLRHIMKAKLALGKILQSLCSFIYF